MARRPKKVFYNKRNRFPKWVQSYVVWCVLAFLALIVVLGFGWDAVRQTAGRGRNGDLFPAGSKHTFAAAAPSVDIMNWLAGINIPGLRTAREATCSSVSFTKPARRPSSETIVLAFDAEVMPAVRLGLDYAENFSKSESVRTWNILFTHRSCLQTITSASAIVWITSGRGVLVPGGRLSGMAGPVWNDLFPFPLAPLNTRLAALADSPYPFPDDVAHVTLALPIPEKSEERIAYFRSLPAILPLLDNQAQNRLISEGLLFSGSVRLHPWAVRLSAWILFFLLLIPMLNRMVLFRETLEPVAGLLSIAYFSFSPVVAWYTSTALQRVWNVPPYSFAVILFLVVMIQARFYHSTLNLRPSITSVQLISNVAIALLASFHSVVWLVVWTPLQLIGNRFRENAWISNVLFAVIGLSAAGWIWQAQNAVIQSGASVRTILMLLISISLNYIFARSNER